MKICIAHPGLGYGGSESKVMVLLDELQHDHEVTLVSPECFEGNRLNAAYHTAVDEHRIRIELTPMPRMLRSSTRMMPLRQVLFACHVRRLSASFDLHISCYNLMPFGVPAVQLVADFDWDEVFCREVNPPRPYPLNLRVALRNAYGRTSSILARAWNDSHLRKRDLIIANSRWTANVLAKRYGIDARVIYPPVHSEPFDPSAPRTSDFVLVGRITPEKRVSDAIAVLERVRAHGHNVNLHIIGPLPKSDYGAHIRKLARLHGDWVRLRDGIYGAEKYAELARHGFALHMRCGEAFGIAVAEQIKMGMIPFVQKNGGPEEIVGDSRLCFDGVDQAVALIDAVLCQPSSHTQLRSQLVQRGDMFSTKRFISDMRAVLREATEARLLGL